MKKWRIILATAGLGIGLASLVGCKKAAENSANATTIRVGEFASLSGTEAAFGRSSHNGTQLAVDELNAAGGILGKKIELVFYDNLSKAGESITVVQKLISRDHVIAVLGEVASKRSLEGADVCQQYKIPMISPSSTNPKVTEKGDYIFRVCFTDPFQGKLIATFVRETLKANKVALLTDVASAYSVGLADYFVAPFKASGGTIIAEQKYSGGDKDFKAQLTAIKALNPDVIFVPGYYGEAGLICQQARQLGITIPIVGGDGWEAQELLEIGKEAMNGTYFSTHYSSENQATNIQQFVKNYSKMNHGDIPDAMGALGYDSMMVLADAIKRAGTTAEPQLRDAIAATKEYEGLTGKTTLDAERNAKKPAVIMVVENGKFKYLKTVNPE